MNISELFISFIVALIVKDFYDILVRHHVTKFISKYKIEKVLKDENRNKES